MVIYTDRAWFEACVSAGELLYGEFPSELLLSMCRLKDNSCSKDDILSASYDSLLMKLEDNMITPAFIERGETFEMLQDEDRIGNPYASLHLIKKELKDLKTSLKKDVVSYYTPSVYDINSIIKFGYIPSTEYNRLSNAMNRKNMDTSYVQKLWSEVLAGKISVYKAAAILNNLFLRASSSSPDPFYFENIKDTFELGTLFLNSIPRRDLKGWSPSALSKANLKPDYILDLDDLYGNGFNKQISKAINSRQEDYPVESDFPFEIQTPFVREDRKIGRNDPCPCGSGKKFKHCCGKAV